MSEPLWTQQRLLVVKSDGWVKFQKLLDERCSKKHQVQHFIFHVVWQKQPHTQRAKCFQVQKKVTQCENGDAGHFPFLSCFQNSKLYEHFHTQPGRPSITLICCWWPGRELILLTFIKELQLLGQTQSFILVVAMATPYSTVIGDVSSCSWWKFARGQIQICICTTNHCYTVYIHLNIPTAV